MAIKILLDPGHGGSESGATANGYAEKDLNLKLALILRDDLQRCGFDVHMTRDTDIYVALETRGQMAVNLGVDSLISLHFNAYNKEAKGFEAIYSFGNDSAKWICDLIFEEMKTLGPVRTVYTKESSSYPGSNYYGVLRSAQPLPGVILEGLFLDNLEDIARLKYPTFLYDLSTAYCKGICAAYGVAYYPKQKAVDIDYKAKYENLKAKLEELLKGE